MRPDSALADSVAPSPNFGDRRGRSIDALVLHYTGMSSGPRALTRLCQAGSEVSCHYFVWEDGRIVQLVAEAARAWHAGRSYWAGERDMNAVSIGIEIVNPGHDGGAPPYPDEQIDAVIALARDLCARHGISPRRVLAHSDIAPDRKIDPGEWFPWRRLAAAGVGYAVEPAPLVAGPIFRRGDNDPDVGTLQADLARLGFDVPLKGIYCAMTEAAVAAFQRHHRPAIVDGQADHSTRATLAALLAGAP